MVEFSGEKVKNLVLVKNFILKGQGIFSLNVNKILRLQVTLNSRYAKNVIRYSFFVYGESNLVPRGGKMRDPGNEVEESHLSQTNRVFLKRGLQLHRGSCFVSFHVG